MASVTNSNATIPTANPKPHQKIEHITIIDAPVETVWAALVDVNDWSWNKWTRLDATESPKEGLKGTLRACYEGNDQDWQTFEFEFVEVNPQTHTLTWKGELLYGCLFSGYHTMELSTLKAGQTKLVHTEIFGGLLPMLRLGLPFPKLDRNYRLMNESLKKHVEKKNKNE
eukprot:CAMPEP_0116146066 /NCGR_PEP_ID=MMETSP0329-20121206/16959_1 /TAXON_ID=697910 /ORGANISM="Pseudo-nitzschia arenysensis, Strain B593" /LENGTH=169 /DNA_ID=CAMNT_0003641775 /DNA_START=138 /DNA_END=647 /DNA_ORIENTATION=+